MRKQPIQATLRTLACGLALLLTFFAVQQAHAQSTARARAYERATRQVVQDFAPGAGEPGIGSQQAPPQTRGGLSPAPAAQLPAPGNRGAAPRQIVPQREIVGEEVYGRPELILDHPGYGDGVIMEPYPDPHFGHGNGCGCGGPTCGPVCAPACGPNCGPSCGRCGPPCRVCIPLPQFSLDNLEVFAGVQGFKGPLNLGIDGSFGFNYGANYTIELPCLSNWHLQAGARVVNSNLSGAFFYPNDERTQVFVTLGGFRRVACGLQGGLVVDYLSDEWYGADAVDLTQLRGELSWKYPCHHEFGFWFTAGQENDELQLRDPFVSSGSISSNNGGLGGSLSGGGRFNVEVNDLFAFFYRWRLDECSPAYGRFFAGWSGNGDGLIGADYLMPVNDNLAVTGGFTYLIPEEGTGIFAGHWQESWNVSVGVVWYPGCGMRGRHNRSLFNVADNGNFLTDFANVSAAGNN